jgi:RimJ/RimL family protein N-acetyltransferase
MAVARNPRRTTLEGQIVRVAPLDPAKHTDALYQATHGPEREAIWRYMSDGPFENARRFHESLEAKAASEDPLYFAIVDRRSQQAVGYAAYLRIDPANRVIEVGSIVYAPGFQRTTGATEAMYLMARHAFEELGYRRYEWKCNALNQASRNAALRLGFTFEGIFRQHMLVKGRNRDTAWYAMLDGEWPERKACLETWLDPANFDQEGRQRTPLRSEPI